MKKNIILAILAVIFSCTPLATVFAGTTGFVNAPLWLSPESPSDGDRVILSTVFRNAEPQELTGTIVFYDGDLLLAQKPITIAPETVGYASTTFTINAGSHLFSATMSNSKLVSSTGKLEVVTLTNATVELPKQFVSKSIAIGAQAGSSSLSSEKPILNQIDQAEKTVIGAIPDSTKTSITGTVHSIENWRETQGTSFSASRDAAQKALDVLSPPVSAKKTPVVLSPSQAYVDRPLDYIKLFFYSALAFVFSNPLAFYIAGLIILYFIVRVILRKIARMRGRKKTAKVSEKAPKK